MTIAVDWDIKYQIKETNLIASGIVDPGVMSSIPARPHIFVEIDHKVLFPLIQEGLLSVKSDSLCTEYWLNT